MARIEAESIFAAPGTGSIYGEAGAQAGPVRATVEAHLGRIVNACDSDTYGGVKPKFSIKDSTGLKASASAGGQITLAGGGQARGECSCGK